MPPRRQAKHPAPFLFGVALFGALGVALTVIERATDVVELGIGGIFVVISVVPLAYAFLRWSRHDHGPGFLASLAAAGVLLAIALTFAIFANRGKSEAAAGRCADPAGTLPPVDLVVVGEARQPERGTACVNERTSARFNNGELIVSLSDINDKGVISGVKLRTNAQRPGTLLSLACPYPNVTNGDLLRLEYESEENFYRWELTVEEVQPASAEMWLAIGEYGSDGRIPSEPLHCGRG